MSRDMTLPHGIDWQTVGVITAIVVAVVSAAAWVMGKVFRLGKISQRLAAVETDIKSISEDVAGARADLTKRIDEVLLAVFQKQVSEAHSPRQLNEEGNRILETSGIKEIVDGQFDAILTKVRGQHPQNAYQGEQVILDAVQDLYGDSELRSRIEQGAFRSGALVGAVLLVGGLYVRDRVLNELGMNPSDIDNHTPQK